MAIGQAVDDAVIKIEGTSNITKDTISEVLEPNRPTIGSSHANVLRMNKHL